jgi:uncharacterized membrane protein
VIPSARASRRLIALLFVAAGAPAWQQALLWARLPLQLLLAAWIWRASRDRA